VKLITLKYEYIDDYYEWIWIVRDMNRDGTFSKETRELNRRDIKVIVAEDLENNANDVVVDDDFEAHE
jgi:hypothetical protein